MDDKLDNNMSYEDAILELTKIVSALNGGKVSLDESIKLYQRGIELASYCDKKLTEVEQKISIVNKANGTIDQLNIDGEN